MKTFPLDPVEGTPMLSEYTLEYTLRTNRWSFVLCTPELLLVVSSFSFKYPNSCLHLYSQQIIFIIKVFFQDDLLYPSTSKYMCWGLCRGWGGTRRCEVYCSTAGRAASTSRCKAGPGGCLYNPLNAAPPSFAEKFTLLWIFFLFFTSCLNEGKINSSLYFYKQK